MEPCQGSNVADFRGFGVKALGATRREVPSSAPELAKRHLSWFRV